MNFVYVFVFFLMDTNLFWLIGEGGVVVFFRMCYWLLGLSLKEFWLF